LYGGNLAAFDGQAADWLSVDAERLAITVSRLPGPEDVTLPVNVQMVVELLSR
jgi:ribosomal protein S4